MTYNIIYINQDGSTKTAEFTTKKATQNFISSNDVAIESVVKTTHKGDTEVTHLFDIPYFADSAERDTENSEEYLSEIEEEFLEKMNEENQQEEENLPEEYFLGREYYPNKGFFSEKEVEKLLWKVLELIKCYPERVDYERMIDEILKLDKELNFVNRSPFSETDKRIFNTEVLLSRLKGLVNFEMWKEEHPHFD